MNVEAYDVDSLRKMVRTLEYENRLLKDKLKKAGIPYDEKNPFEEKVENAEEYDLDQGERIVRPPSITEEMAIRFFSMFWGREDVYARRGKNGGYFPQCDNRWNARLCPKQRKEIATGQKIGEGFDFPRLDVLLLAAPVSFEGRLEQYVGRLNRDYEGKEAVLVYDYIDSHVRFFDRMYAKRLRTYKKIGFSIWTEQLQSKQVINAIFDSGNYTEKFEQDLVESEKTVVISSPDIRQDKIDRFLFLVKARQEVGVQITVITTDPEEAAYGNSDVFYELIRTMEQVGINVVIKEEVEERFAVIDDELVWHGGMNLLGKVDVWDNLMRIRNYQVAAELLEIALGSQLK